jgi:epoxyqueuosine reductase QueG
MVVSEKIIAVRERIGLIALSYGIAKAGYAPIDGIPLTGEVMSRAKGMSHAVSLIWEIPSVAAYDRSENDRFYDAMLEGRSRMDEAANAIAKLLTDNGYQALPITSAFTADPKTISGQISHKAVAHQAGMGWIGRSLLLVTPEFGPRVRLMTILTDAELDDGPHPMDNRCGSCRNCIDGCLLKALRYAEFHDHPEDRSALFNYMSCHRQEKAWLNRSPPRFCAKCISNCPWGRISPI